MLLEDVRDVTPNSTSHWVLFTLHEAKADGVERLTAREVVEQEPRLHEGLVTTAVTTLHSADGVSRVKLASRPYNPYGYSLTDRGRAVLAGLGAPTRVPDRERKGERVQRSFSAPVTSTSDARTAWVVGPTGEHVERNQTPHWVLFRLAEADTTEDSALPVSEVLERLDAVESTDRVEEACNRFVEYGWAEVVESTPYKYSPRGYQVTPRGMLTLQRSGAPTRTPENTVASGEPVDVTLPEPLEATDAVASPDTMSLEPDWGWLERRLVALAQYELAAKARDEALTPQEVYGSGGVLDVLYAEQQSVGAA